MVSAEVQRTLVKSPPELWAELSDPSSLARHLGELGEIRITRVDSEEMVEWEGEDISGTVFLKPSGWGTKVTLAVTRELPEPEVRAALEPPSGAVRAASAQAEPDAPVQAEPEPATRRGFFSKLFRRGPRKEPVEPVTSEAIANAEGQAEPSEVAPPGRVEEVAAVEASAPVGSAESGAVDIAAEPREAEVVTSEQVTAVLTAVLDRLGAAHHRPFSRG